MPSADDGAEHRRIHRRRSSDRKRPKTRASLPASSARERHGPRPTKTSVRAILAEGYADPHLPKYRRTPDAGEAPESALYPVRAAARAPTRDSAADSLEDPPPASGERWLAIDSGHRRPVETFTARFSMLYLVGF